MTAGDHMFNQVSIDLEGGQHSPPQYSLEDHVAALRRDPIGQLRRDLRAMGLHPQLKVGELIYLAKASGYAGRPMSMQIRGASEAGKSTIAEGVMSLHPREDRILAMEITWAALMDGAGHGSDLRMVTIHFDEGVEIRKHDPKLMAALRELTTKASVTRIKQVNGVPTPITVQGPVPIIDTMLEDTQLSAQDANRFLAAAVNDDPQTRRLVCELNCQRFGPAGEARKKVGEMIAVAHQTFLRTLRKDIVVFTPPGLYGTGESHRFDSMVYSLTCVVAWLHQCCRPITPGGQLVATADDYRAIWNLLTQTRILAPGSELPESQRRILQKWQEYSQAHSVASASTTDLHDHLAPDMDAGALCRILKQLRDAEYAEIVRRGERGLHYLRLTALGESYAGCDWVSKLPSPDAISPAQSCAAPRDGYLAATERVAPDPQPSGAAE